MAEKEDPEDWQRLWELIWSCAIGQAIHVAVQLRIPESLEAGPRSAPQLAAETSTDPWAVETLLRALAAFDVLRVESNECFTLTAAGRLLLQSSADSFAGEAGDFFETLYRPLGALMHMVRTGEVAFDHVYGMSFYEHMAKHPALAAFFHDAMARHAPSRYAGLSSVHDFTSVSRVIDVGGSEGALLVQILREHPRVTGVLLDMPVAIERARARLEAAELSDRCELIAGDFLESVPPDGDLYVLAQVLNNWRDHDARRVLMSCRSAMRDEARLLVLESVHMPDLPMPPWRALVSLGVMVQRGGRTRSVSQLRALFEATGFRLQGVRRLPGSETYAIEAVPSGELGQ